MARLLVGKGIKFEVPLEDPEMVPQENDLESVSLLNEIDILKQRLTIQKFINLGLGLTVLLTLFLHLI